ncbi:MAG: hypothetical protein PUB01_07245, partial [Desulfovibrionaceae bacterium]|nr:hypothetical protein [Desulfovibrionaceae bacterium]
PVTLEVDGSSPFRVANRLVDFLPTNFFADIAQEVECILGKDEVTGSIPVKGSREYKPLRFAP